MPFTCLYNIYAAALRSIGDSKTPIRYLIVSCLVNMTPDLVFVVGFHLNVLGAALATVIAQGRSAVRKIEDIGLLPGRSISTGIMSFTAQNKGAKNESRIEQGFRLGMRMEIIVGMAMCAVVLLLRFPLMSLFTQDESIIAGGVRYFNLIGFCYALPCVTNGLQGCFRGIGRMKITLLATLTQISVCVISTLLLTPMMGISGVGLACVLGWTAMIAWELPMQMHIRRVS